MSSSDSEKSVLGTPEAFGSGKHCQCDMYLQLVMHQTRTTKHPSLEHMPSALQTRQLLFYSPKELVIVRVSCTGLSRPRLRHVHSFHGVFDLIVASAAVPRQRHLDDDEEQRPLLCLACDLEEAGCKGQPSM